ncbi:UNVERIFIED_CONTAM: hypothetical protein K2H54_019995 [Gekko kuhli]
MTGRHRTRTQNTCSFRSSWRHETTEQFPVGLLLPFPGTLPQKPVQERRENPLPGFLSCPHTPPPHLGAVTNTDKLTSFTWDPATDKTWPGACFVLFCFPVRLLAANLEGLPPSFWNVHLASRFDQKAGG